MHTLDAETLSKKKQDLEKERKDLKSAKLGDEHLLQMFLAQLSNCVLNLRRLVGRSLFCGATLSIGFSRAPISPDGFWIITRR